MLTPEEKKFFEYWKDQRNRKKQFLRKLSIGMPLGVLVAGTLLINLFSGWYKKATMVLNSDPSLILVILVALIGIVIFITIFSAYHKWDMNESLYQELVKKNDEENDHMQQLS
jgi:amino acid transporter